MSDQTKSRFHNARKLGGSVLLVCAAIYLLKFAPIQIVQAVSHFRSPETTVLEQSNTEGNLNLSRFEMGNPAEMPSIWNFVRKNPFSVLNNDSYLMNPINTETGNMTVPFCSLYENSLITFVNDDESWIYSGEPFGKAATTPFASESSTFTPTDTPTMTETLTPTETRTPTETGTPTGTPTATDPAPPTSTSTLTETATETLTPSSTHTITLIPTITNTQPTMTPAWTHTSTLTQTLVPTLTVTSVTPVYISSTATPSGSWIDQLIHKIPTLNWFPTRIPTATKTLSPTVTKTIIPILTLSPQDAATSGINQMTMTSTITPLTSEQDDQNAASNPFWLFLGIGGGVIGLIVLGIFRLRKSSID